jgi:riboflavin synthase
MFTGIIAAVGEVAALEPKAGDLRLRVKSGKLNMQGVGLGDSIATNGVCLTATELTGDGYWADVSAESVQMTTLGTLRVGSRVNLELALTPETHLGGHLVTGHVDGVGEIVERKSVGQSVRFRVRAPDTLAKYIAKKGSVCVDGISLTVNQVDGAIFDLNIVPHTLQETIMGEYEAGRRVNLEVDIIARYLERLLLGERAAEPGAGGITESFLAEHGFGNRS